MQMFHMVNLPTLSYNPLHIHIRVLFSTFHQITILWRLLLIDIVVQSISYRHTVYIWIANNFSHNYVSLHVCCAWAVSYQTNSKEIYAARVVVSSRLHISPSFHLLTMLLYCLLLRIRTNFYGANMHGGKNLYVFVVASPRQIYELFFISENGSHKRHSSSYKAQMQIYLCSITYAN